MGAVDAGFRLRGREARPLDGSALLDYKAGYRPGSRSLQIGESCNGIRSGPERQAMAAVSGDIS